MSKALVKSGEVDNIQAVAGKVAWGATGVALTAAVVAVGALLLTDSKTRNKISGQTKEAVFNIRRLMEFLTKTGKKASETLEELTPKN